MSRKAKTPTKKTTTDIGANLKYLPEEIIPLAEKYIQWCDKHPFYESKVFGTGKRMRVSKVRASTIEGFCLYIKIGRQTWYDYKKRPEYEEIINYAHNMFFVRNLEYSAAGFLEPKLMQSYLGITEKKEVEHYGKEGGPINFANISDDDIREYILNATIGKAEQK